MSDFDLHRWFDRDELAPCPACGQRSCIELRASGSVQCIACGYLQTLVPDEADETPLGR